LVSETLDKRRSSVLQLEEILAEIDRAHDNLAMLRVMEASASVLRNLNKEIGGVERVERITERLNKEMDKVEDVNAVIGEVGEVVIDEGEVDDELEELERAEREKKKKEAEDKREEAVVKEDERRAEETKRRLAELEILEKKRQEAEVEIGSKKSSEDQELGESTKKMGRMSLEDGRPIAKSQSDDDQPKKEEAQVLAS
jgi:charged multivesicular body protein 7